MQQQQSIHKITVTWRGKKLVLEMTSGATVGELGQSLQKLTHVKADTLRLIVPSNKSSKLLSPFSDEHSCLSLQETSIFEGKFVMMMGVLKDEVDQVLQNAKADNRIAGFDEEEKRHRQRMLNGPRLPQKLPQGNYIFCEFRTLHIPGIELTPPASEALKLMHKLAADPGIVAIMNKYHWRVGIMTEMAPEGYVGVSPVCILGFNKNHGEEISLRLRTDDLKGFRKYDSIKKTLLHELAHMIYSEHDANFYALDSQLNKEAATLDWTRSTSHTVSGVRVSQHYEEEFYTDNSSTSSQKLGGKGFDQLVNARESSVAAAYRRIEGAFSDVAGTSEIREEPDPDDSELNIHHRPGSMHDVGEVPNTEVKKGRFEPFNEPDPDDSESMEGMDSEPHIESSEKINFREPDPDDSAIAEVVPPLINDGKLAKIEAHEEPDPDDLDVPLEDRVMVEPNHSLDSMDSQIQPAKSLVEPDPDDSGARQTYVLYGNTKVPDQGDSFVLENMKNQSQLIVDCMEPDPDDSQKNGAMQAEPDPDDNMVSNQDIFRTQTAEPDPDDQELQRIQDPVTVVCSRLQKAIEMLQSEVNPSEAATVLQTLFKIIRNVIEHPDEMKFRKLRKANPIIHRNVASHKAAMEILLLIGFNEDVVLDEIGKAETYLVLKRNDPGLLWLAKSSLETCNAY